MYLHSGGEGNYEDKAFFGEVPPQPPTNTAQLHFKSTPRGNNRPGPYNLRNNNRFGDKNNRVFEHVVSLEANEQNGDAADFVPASTSNQRVFEHVVPLEANELNVDIADSLIQDVAVSMDKANDDARASSSFTTNEETNAWDDWEPNAMDYSNLEYSATHEQATLPNLSFNNAVVEPSIGDIAIKIDPPIPIVVNHPAEINVCNVPVKLSRKERIAAAIDGRDVQWFVLDITALDRCLIGIHDDMKKLLSFINAQSDHQFKESDIMERNLPRVVGETPDKSHSHHGKYFQKISWEGSRLCDAALSNHFSMIPNPQAVSFNYASALPSSSTSNSSNGNLSSTEPQSGFTASRQTGTVTKSKTPISVLRLYSVSNDVTFTMLADFVSQCGPLLHMQTEKSGINQTKTTFVELVVKPAVAKAFVDKWRGKCRLNNTNFAMYTSHFPYINNKTDKAKDEMIAYRAAKLSEN
ncbi:hypothetical protein DAPPUDRAFT_111381 [Daphnia pulex]|uniref:Uncharacterized protein n=1 Tax=Daphnia pulex TaxID=6669 RepID=E9H900_DAPPU|nr:hypothetical protein DAPPUDRAFT_111381 [Daphnia pulex]|eukprot:EFX71781.1 hypothetical protein DAPPUDRAFT_111381 [Daphnia pulex]